MRRRNRSTSSAAAGEVKAATVEPKLDRYKLLRSEERRSTVGSIDRRSERPQVPSLEPMWSRTHQAPTSARVWYLKHVFVAVQRPDAGDVVVTAVGIVVPVAAAEDIMPDRAGIFLGRESVIQAGAGESGAPRIVTVDLRV